LARILIVDDEPGVREVLRRLVAAEGHVATVTGDTTAARAELGSGAFELILCDVNLPGESGLELVHEVVAGDTEVAVLMVSGADDPQLAETALGLGAYGYIVKPFRNSEVNIGIANALRRRRLEIENKAHHERLEQLVAERTAELGRSREETIHRLARAAELRDHETGQHIERVSRCSQLIAQRLGLPPDRCELLRIASPLHDIGKIAIPDSILHKPGPLTDDERRIVETHTELGHTILADSREPLIQLGAEIAWTHHERFDGGGYPRSLVGDEIPLAGRIVAVADVFDALVSDRVYRSALPVEEVVHTMRAEQGAHFDPEALEALLSAIPEAIAIRDRFRDEERHMRLIPAPRHSEGPPVGSPSLVLPNVRTSVSRSV
jgi:putative two-component system response regulator